MAKKQVYRDPSRQSPQPPDQEQPAAPREAAPPGTSVEEDASRSTADFVQNVRPLQERKQKARKRRTVLIIIVLLLALGGGGYTLYAYFQRNTEKEQPQETSQPQKKSSPESDTEGRYVSADLNLSLDHPADWQADDSEQGMLKLSSPVTKFTDNAGQELDARVVISIVPTNADSDFPKDQATAVRESIKFSYDSPAEEQRQETYLSFMNLDGPSEGLNAIYITGDSNYVKGDPVAKADFDTVEPIIWLEFYACPGGTCSDTEKLTVTADAWDSNTTLKSALSILKSLNIK